MDANNSPNQPLKRRRCPNCQKVFQPTRRWARFHNEKCRKEFHRYGAGYYPIKAGLEKAIEKKYAELQKDIKASFVIALRRHEEIDRELTRLSVEVGEIKRSAVEVTKLRAEIDALRGQFEKHTHDVFEYSEAGGEVTGHETYGPRY